MAVKSAPRQEAAPAKAQSIKAPEAKATEPKAAPKGKSKKGLVIAVLAVLLAAGGGAAAWLLSGAEEKAEGTAAAKPEAKAEPQKPPVFVNLEPFTVNLQREDADQYLQVAVTLKVADSATAEGVKSRMPEVRNNVLLLLSSKRASQLNSPESKAALAAEIAEAVRKAVPTPAPTDVSGIFFTSFLIQ